MKKIIVFSLLGLIIVFLGFFILAVDVQETKKKIKSGYLKNRTLQTFMTLPDIVKSTLFIFAGKRSFSNLNNDYNVKFLPETQKIKIDFKKIKTSFTNTAGKGESSTTFFVESIGDSLIVARKSGEFYLYKISSYMSQTKKINHKRLIVNNLKKDKLKLTINDTKIIDNYLFVLSSLKKSEDCTQLRVHYAEVDDVLDFKLFKFFDECITANRVNYGLPGGSMEKYFLNGSPGLLVSTASLNNVHLGAPSVSQNDDSILGKILFIYYDSKEHIILSKGHRNPQGLTVKNNLIISSEHGPVGGDEINNIKYKNNYGWPLASYGEPEMNRKNEFKKSHSENGFAEPIFTFIPSVGLSELIYLPNTFHEEWNDNLIVSSLNGKHLFRFKFKDNKFENILFKENIYIGERIRDINYNKKNNIIILALETTGSVGILSPKN